jgi:transcriptional regulator with XRE-family HTH domain
VGFFCLNVDGEAAMIASGTVAEIRRWLAQGNLSQRKIAQRTGVSRGTVATIAAGKRPDYEALRQHKLDEFAEPTGPPQRCPGCGRLVIMPCLACRAEEALADASQRRRPRFLPTLDEPLGLKLKADDQRRYEEVRAQRLAEPKAIQSDAADPAEESLAELPPDGNEWGDWDEPECLVPQDNDLDALLPEE